jgi:hypothetical protein
MFWSNFWREKAERAGAPRKVSITYKNPLAISKKSSGYGTKKPLSFIEISGPNMAREAGSALAREVVSLSGLFQDNRIVQCTNLAHHVGAPGQVRQVRFLM